MVVGQDFPSRAVDQAAAARPAHIQRLPVHMAVPLPRDIHHTAPAQGLAFSRFSSLSGDGVAAWGAVSDSAVF